jgi:hypothetical protein
VQGKQDSSGDEVGVWVSADGRAWQRVADGPGLAGETVAGWGVFSRRILVLTEKGSVIVGAVLP